MEKEKEKRKARPEPSCKKAWTTIILVVVLIYAIVGSSLGNYSFSSITTGKISNLLDVHRFCMKLSSGQCRDIDSDSNITADGYVMFDISERLLVHHFLMRDFESYTISSITVNGPKEYEEEELAETSYIPYDGTSSLNVTIDEDTGVVSGVYKLKTGERNDLPFAKALVKNPHLFYLVVTTEENPDGAICGEFMSECRVPFDYNHKDYP